MQLHMKDLSKPEFLVCLETGNSNNALKYENSIIINKLHLFIFSVTTYRSVCMYCRFNLTTSQLVLQFEIIFMKWLILGTSQTVSKSAH